MQDSTIHTVCINSNDRDMLIDCIERDYSYYDQQRIDALELAHSYAQRHPNNANNYEENVEHYQYHIAPCSPQWYAEKLNSLNTLIERMLS